jgi:DNA invertase Pin-like site-specific DNA recombinase
MSNTAQGAANSDCRKEAEMSKNTGKITILYERLSRDDGEDSLSNSIVNQQQLLEDYAQRNNLIPYRHIADDGISGTAWNRPGWQELISEVEAGNVKAIVVKNLDRMGRDYLRVGLYMEQFRDCGVRLVAISDGIDTAAGEDDFTPFRAILAEWYAKDCSKKIRTIFNSRMAAGYHCSGSIPYGYLHDPADRQNWLLDESAAEVVRRIFQLVIDGKGVYQIAHILEADKVLIPSAHAVSLGISPHHPNYKNPYAWRGGVVSTILARREYMGVKILKKTFSESYKQKKRKNTPSDEQLMFEGGIPQIVDAETWELAQKLRRTVRRPAKDGSPPSPLTGLLYCHDCGKKLTHARNFDHQKNFKRDEYICGNYRQGTKNCTMHYIRASAATELIINAIRGVAACVRQNETEFIARVRQASNLRAEAEVKEGRKRLSKAARRSDELDTIIKKLYETFALGKLPENHFDRMLAEYDTEQAELRQTIAELQTEADDFAADSVKADRFIEIVSRYTDFDELTVPMMNEFVERVIVHEGVKSGGKRTQEVEIVFNFIGKFDAPPLPKPLPIVDEAEELAKQEANRAKNREKLRTWRAKKKAEKAAAELAATQTKTA